MADVTVTAASVKPTGTTEIDHGRAGAAITQGQAVYKDANGLYQLSDCDSGTAALRDIDGIALNEAGASGQPLAVATGGDVTFNAGLTAGVEYYVSATAGGLAPYADLGSGDYVIRVGYATSTTNLHVDKAVTGVSL